MYIHELQIGNVNIKNNVLLAPMAGVTDMPFRIICKEMGAGLVYTEMVSSKGLFYKDKKTKKIMEIDDFERPVAVQIFGSDAKIMGEIAKEVSKEADIVDINIGCPAPKVVKNNEGSKLLLDLNKIDIITKEVVKNSSVPVTIKIRKGWDNKSVVAVDVAKIAEANGVSAITIHGRTREEFFNGEIDYDIIKKVKENVKIPVIGNGNIFDANSAKTMFEKTNCDAVMVARGAQGNPWIFEEIISELRENKEYTKPTIEDIKKIMLRHLNMLKDYKNEKIAVLEMRKHVSWYTKGLQNSSIIRSEVNKIEDFQELVNKINSL